MLPLSLHSLDKARFVGAGAGWDSWAAVGITKGGHSSGPSTHTAGYVPNFGKWRDPTVAKGFVSNPSKTGSGASTQWLLPVRVTHAKTHEKYATLCSSHTHFLHSILQILISAVGLGSPTTSQLQRTAQSLR